LENIRRLRDLKFHELLYEMLAKQYEIARIDEAKNAPVIQVVDRAIPPEKRTFPKRTLLTMLGAFLSATLAIAFVSVRHALTSGDRAHKLEQLSQHLSFGAK
jgi:uncharacterized protein involved in exopolysaccharide biosynthesis